MSSIQEITLQEEEEEGFERRLHLPPWTRCVRQLAGGAAHVHGGGPGRSQVTQRLPDEGHGVIPAGACPQLHGQAETADDGDRRGAPHLEEEEEEESQHHMVVFIFDLHDNLQQISPNICGGRSELEVSPGASRDPNSNKKNPGKGH
ncbi:hypothetical protein EYF80_020260 [Liparis tanakae]|uniref:Uncharacterized protein n=1 Tax=Liparis tanakae TaxID=230148 RepID=A0A4Z2HUA3_9TELE|nr:hypothetical protein EYF80_020260 [Liparis tanakae]